MKNLRTFIANRNVAQGFRNALIFHEISCKFSKFGKLFSIEQRQIKMRPQEIQQIIFGRRQKQKILSNQNEEISCKFPTNS
jgi:hypothetical protein